MEKRVRVMVLMAQELMKKRGMKRETLQIIEHGRYNGIKEAGKERRQRQPTLALGRTSGQRVI